MIKRLVCHPDTPSSTVSEVTAQLCLGDPGEIWVEFMIAPTAGVVLPPPKPAKRTDNLWQSTCFELFLKPDGEEGYFEFNLSPSFEWAAYEFDSYRSGMRDYSVSFDPEIEITSSRDQVYYWLATDLPLLDPRRSDFRVCLAAIIEEKDGSKSYWALAHPPGPPDFHHDACFALPLADIGAA
jgi:hypothetical protein